MPAYKAVQYAVWCDFCDDFIDYGDANYSGKRDALKQWRSKGWRKIGDKWACPKCAAKPKAQEVPHA